MGIAEGSDTQQPVQNSVKVNPASVDIAHLAQVTKLSSLPRTKLTISNQEFVALWDTGAEITGIRKDIAQQIKAPIDTDIRIPYRDVNGNINYTVGVASWSFGGVQLQAHVIDGLSHAIIIGWDTITALEGNVDSKTKTININIKNKQIQ